MVEKNKANMEEFYNLNDLTQGLKRELAPGLNTRIFVGDNLMLSVVEIDPNSKGDAHSHPEEQWGVLLEGDGIRDQNGVNISVTAGDFWRTPGGVSHGFTAGPNGAKVLDIFSPPRAAYKAIGAGFSAD
jgi:quercetin dioxygenase-like cupin family protein